MKPQEEEVRRLRRDLKRVRQERDILKKALAIFSDRRRWPSPAHGQPLEPPTMPAHPRASTRLAIAIALGSTSGNRGTGGSSYRL